MNQPNNPRSNDFWFSSEVWHSWREDRDKLNQPRLLVIVPILGKLRLHYHPQCSCLASRQATYIRKGFWRWRGTSCRALRPGRHSCIWHEIASVWIPYTFYHMWINTGRFLWRRIWRGGRCRCRRPGVWIPGHVVFGSIFFGTGFLEAPFSEGIRLSGPLRPVGVSRWRLQIWIKL